jgi:hypothetical protein
VIRRTQKQRVLSLLAKLCLIKRGIMNIDL